MGKSQSKMSKNNESVEEVKIDLTTNNSVHGAEEFQAEKKSKVKRDGTVDKRSLKSDAKKDLAMQEMAMEIKKLKGDKTDREIKAEAKQKVKDDKENSKREKKMELERKRVERENKKQAMEEILSATQGKGARITKFGKVDMRGRSKKCLEHQQNIIGTMREALRKSYADKAKKHIDDEDVEFEIVPVPTLEKIVERIDREKEKVEKEKEPDYRALYETLLSSRPSLENEMASARKSGQKKILQNRILQGVL